MRCLIVINNIQAPIRSSLEPGVSYINSEKGLIRIDNYNNSYSVAFENNMEPLRETIRLMTQDNDGYIWMNNNDGLIRVDPLTETVDYFELPIDKYRPWFAFPTTLPNGEIIFAGVNSYVRFNPADLESTNPTGKSIITSLQAGSETYDLTYSSAEPQIQSDQNSLTFKFIGLDFKDPASVNYRYRILGSANEQWNSIGTQRSVFIPNLESGTYTFEVQSGSQTGNYNETTASQNFSILPPWWNTLPAYFLYLLILGALIYSVDRIQRKRLIQKERERTREKELTQAKEIEKAYKNLEIAHENLKSAQTQLVQQEKLASLGQLTAGIAHEIKNPLNFVNNFSEVSIEMIEEVREEIAKILGGDGSEGADNAVRTSRTVRTSRDLSVQEAESPPEPGSAPEPKSPPEPESAPEPESQNSPPNAISEILNDIEANLKKIYEHGSRANGIVQSMLLHSRGGTGNLEPKDLNGLVKEYVNLSFHGMRAGKNPINVDIQFELDESIGEVPLIAEDFSRVILNLCNNAFDACAERSQSTMRSKLTEDGRPVTAASYLPELTVRTKSKSSSITIEIEDNGPGIPDEIKDKIMQPFFTTKKGTAGTGLGLSITNDIIKAHGGSMDIDSQPGQNVFKIKLIG